MGNLPQPLPGHVLIEWQPNRPDKVEIADNVELVLPDAEYEKVPSEGYVLAAASDVTEVKVGDYAYFNETNPIGFDHEGKKMMRIKQENITARRDES